MRRNCLLATVLLAALCQPSRSAAQPAPGPVRMSFLAPEQVFPLTGAECGCIAFRRGSEPVAESILFSSTPSLGRIRLARRDYELSHRDSRLVGGRFVNSFVGRGVRVSVVATEASFEQLCSAYADPPPHGSCFSGLLEARVGRQSASTPVVQLCGC